jgi:hypothetical protein
VPAELKKKIHLVNSCKGFQKLIGIFIEIVPVTCQNHGFPADDVTWQIVAKQFAAG